MKIEIWSIGKKNDSFIEEGTVYYFNKIKHYFPIELIIIDNKKLANISNMELLKKEEEKLILNRINENHTLVLLDERGKLLSSPEFSERLQIFMNNSTKTLVFLIGGAYGVSDVIKQRANLTWSFSKLVFPHQIMRLLVAEQLFRGISILNNTGYHHE